MRAKKKSARVIERLRALYPDLSWRYEKNWRQHEYPPAPWYNNEGWGVIPYAAMSRCCMDACDHYRTVYRRSDTNEDIYLDFYFGVT